MEKYDKAKWQIDGGIPKDLVVNHFKTVFAFLDEHDMLNEEGKEELEFGIDEEAILTENLVTKEGAEFLKNCYDNYLLAIAKDKYGNDIDGKELEKIYYDFKNN